MGLVIEADKDRCDGQPHVRCNASQLPPSYRAALNATRSIHDKAVRPSVIRVNCDKRKARSEKSSIMTNRKSTTSFSMSLR